MGQLINGEFINVIRAAALPGKTRDYSTLATWESDRQGDLTVSGFVEVAEVDGHGSVGTVIVAGWTTDADNYVHIRPRQGREATSKYRGSNAAFVNASAAIGISISNVDFTRVTGMTVRQTGNFDAISFTSSDGARCEKNFCFGGGIFIEGTSAGVGNQCITQSNIIIDGGNGTNRAAISTATSSSTALIHRCYNNTVVSGVGGIRKTDSNNTQSRNNYYHTTDGNTYVGTFAGNQHDVTADGDSLVNADFRNVAFDDPSIFKDAHEMDFTLVQGAFPMVASGQNMNVPGVFVIVPDDINDIKRPIGSVAAAVDGLFSIGADQFFFEDPRRGLGGYVLAEPGFPASGILGGWTIGQPPFDSFNNFVGGFLQAEGIPGQDAVAVLGGFASGFAFVEPPKSVGGYVNSLPLISCSGVDIGGAASGLFSHGPDVLGGFVWGIPGFRQSTEMHARTLAKANSEDAFQQGLNVDAIIAFIQREQEDFNALFRVANTFNSSFNSRLVVGQNKMPPRVVITDVTPASGLPGVSGIQVCVTASGNLFDGEQWVINHIDFGEPVRDSLPTPNNSISGFDLGSQNPAIWSGCYTYRDAGVYVITARGVDDLGMVGMDHYVLNLASGLTACTDYPCISISGVPRLGTVPPQLQVDFTTDSMGTFAPSTPTDENLFWNFGNLARSNKVDPFTYYASPGLYTPVARFRVQVGGSWRWGADTLRVGFNF